MVISIIQAHFKMKIRPNMSEQEKEFQRIYDVFNAKTNPQFHCLLYTKQRKQFFTEKELFRGKEGVEDWTKNEKNTFFISSSLRWLRRTPQRQ